MRKLLLLLVASLALVGPVKATNIGYCAGEVSKSGSFSIEGNTDVSGAIYLTPAFLATYDGNEISALRGALASKVNLDKLTLWVRESLDGANLAEATVTSSTTPALAKGWIEVSLDTPIKIDASKGLYLGMTYHQKAASKAFSLIGNGFVNSFFMQAGEGEWEDRHEEGILSIEAVTEGDATPEYDLALLEARMDYSSDPAANLVTVRVANNGSRDVTGFTLECTYANTPSDATTQHFDTPVASGEKRDVVCRIPKTEDVFVNPLTVVLTGIDGGEDSYTDNNTTVAKVPTLKKVLVEEFTTERCSNCPRVAKYIHDVTAEDAYKDRVIVVCHHAGYYTDWLTQPCDEEIGWLYGCNSAPAVMYDRTYLPRNVMTDCPETKDLRTNFDRQLNVPASVGISITTETDIYMLETVVNVSLKRETALSFTDPRLTVYLTEDNITPQHQSGDSDGTHIHQHVIRAYNSTWGNKIEWDGSNSNVTYRFQIDPDWKIEDLKVVAFVNNYDPDNKGNNKIDNAEMCSLNTTPNSIETVGSEEIVECRYFDLSGCEVSGDTAGFLLKVVRYADGRTVTEKILRK